MIYCLSALRALHSFPTRRSSDLTSARDDVGHVAGLAHERAVRPVPAPPDRVLARVLQQPPPRVVRSEEHTSELQSHVNLVCRLLLEKKNMAAIASKSPAAVQQAY